MVYRLWDTDIGRLLGRFDTEEEALRFVGTLLDAYPNLDPGDLSLGAEHEDGTRPAPVSGEALVARVEQAMAASSIGAAR